MTLIELALAWAINHPGVTSAIIGPRTMEQLESQLPAADITLSAEILDRIDEVVAPGVTLNVDDNSYGAAELTPRHAAGDIPRAVAGAKPRADDTDLTARRTTP